MCVCLVSEVTALCFLGTQLAVMTGGPPVRGRVPAMALEPVQGGQTGSSVAAGDFMWLQSLS